MVGRPPVSGDAFLGVRLQFGRKRLVVQRLGGTSHMMMKHELALTVSVEPRVQRLHIGQHRSVLGARVLEVDSPFDGGKVVILDCHAADDESRLRIAKAKRMPAAAIIQLFARVVPIPRPQRLRGRLSAVGERERRLGGV